MGKANPTKQKPQKVPPPRLFLVSRSEKWRPKSLERRADDVKSACLHRINRAPLLLCRPRCVYFRNRITKNLPPGWSSSSHPPSPLFDSSRRFLRLKETSRSFGCICICFFFFQLFSRMYTRRLLALSSWWHISLSLNFPPVLLTFFIPLVAGIPTPPAARGGSLLPSH